MIFVAVMYAAAEILLDAAAAWIIYTAGHRWWALAYCIISSYGSHVRVYRLTGERPS